MKSKLFYLAFLGAYVVFFGVPSPVQAHTINQPPFIYINNKPTGYYPVTYSSLPDFHLPQDSSPVTPVKNQPITFHLDTSALPILPEALANQRFHWDWGDGSTTDGTDFTHTYTSAGPKILTVTNTDITVPTTKPQTLDIILINVLPSQNYILPIARFTVNGVSSKGNAKDTLQADFKEKTYFDASSSQPGSSAIVSYQWDLGDQELAIGQKVTHSYNANLSVVDPVLRVTDSQGFYADMLVQVANGTTTVSPSLSLSPENPSSHTKILLYSGIGLVVLAGALVSTKALSGGGKKKR